MFPSSHPCLTFFVGVDADVDAINLHFLRPKYFEKSSEKD